MILIRSSIGTQPIIWRTVLNNSKQFSPVIMINYPKQLVKRLACLCLSHGNQRDHLFCKRLDREIQSRSYQTYLKAEPQVREVVQEQLEINQNHLKKNQIYFLKCPRNLILLCQLTFSRLIHKPLKGPKFNGTWVCRCKPKAKIVQPKGIPIRWSNKSLNKGYPN